VVGYDDILIASHTVPALTTLRMPITEIVKHAVARAVKLARDPESVREPGRIPRGRFTPPFIGDGRIGVVTRHALVRDLPPEILVVRPIVAGAHRPLAAAFAVPAKR
jgi:hypothetical protein